MERCVADAEDFL
jgi:hypothetical protein